MGVGMQAVGKWRHEQWASGGVTRGRRKRRWCTGGARTERHGRSQRVREALAARKACGGVRRGDLAWAGGVQASGGVETAMAAARVGCGCRVAAARRKN